MVEGQKMAKSLGNFFTLRDLLAKGWTGREVRYALISVNYRLPLNFTFDGLAGARAALQRIDEWAGRIAECGTRNAESRTSPDSQIAKSQDGFANALDDDLNISGALGHLFDVIRESNRLLDQSALSAADAQALLAWWDQINGVLRFEPDAVEIPVEILALLEERKQAREAKEWKKSDELRDRIAALGWQVKDTKDGQKWTRVG